jgi:hypothetical protein
MKRLTDAK